MQAVLMSPPAMILHPEAAPGLWQGRCGDRSHPSAFLVVWGIFFLMGFCAEAWEDKGQAGVAMPGGVRGRFGGLCVAKPPQCLRVSQAPARRGRGTRAEPREMPINSLRIIPSHVSVTLLRRDVSVCPAGLARLVSPLRHWKGTGQRVLEAAVPG